MTKKPEKCLVCNEAKVTWPAVICSTCIESPAAIKAMRRYRRSRLPKKKGSVRAVSGGLPSLGKRT